MGVAKQQYDSISIPICEGTNAESILYRIKRGSTLHLHPDAGLLGREIVIHTNYPEEGKKFKRTEYRILDWYLKNGKKITTNKFQSAHVVDTDIFTQLKMSMSGTFRFWFHYKERYDVLVCKFKFLNSIRVRYKIF